MMKSISGIISFGLVLVLLSATAASALPFTARQSTNVLAAPASDAKVVASLPEGTVVEVTHQAGNYWRVEAAEGKSGYVPAESLQQAKTKGGPLVPIVVSLATPAAKVVIDKAVKLFKETLGIRVDQASVVVRMEAGTELTVIGTGPDNSLKVRTADGKEGLIRSGPQVLQLQPVQYASAEDEGVWKNGRPIPAGAGALTLHVQVLKADGARVPPGGTLKAGDEYRIFITPSADSYVRVTAVTPDKDRVCQYYPNRFPGTQSSVLFKAGNAYSSEMLPQGVKFKVSDPVGKMDVLRIEATQAGPYIYVADGDGCVTTSKYRGGGFSVSGPVTNPVAQYVIEYPINTVK
jgi:hypothetical protein